jgi:hypothetical protein
MPDRVVKRGALPSPRSALAAAIPFPTSLAAPANFLVKPKQISMWGNDVHGDCVTAEEAFAKACNDPEIFISDAQVIAWATKHGVLEGAYLVDVLTWMQNDGFPGDGVTYDDGTHFSVDWTNAATLRSAIAEGPVKIGVAADQIEAAWYTTSGESGWFATGFHADANEDHCTSLCGYGSISWLAQQLGVKVPAGIDGTKPGYAMFTWDSIGIIDVPSMIAVTHEAWLRRPTTVTRQQGGWVGRWAELYKDTDNLATLDVANSADGRIEVFGVNTQGHVLHTWQTTPTGGWLGHWSELYTDNDKLTMLRVARNKDGRLEVFGVNAQGHVLHTWQTSPSGSFVGHWADLYTGTNKLTMLDVASNADGRIEVFGVDAQGHVLHTWQKTANGAWFGSWAKLYSDTDTLTVLRVARNKDGRLEVFGVDSKGRILHTWQKVANGAWLGRWSELYTDTDKLTFLRVGSNKDGRLEVFGVDPAGHIVHTWQS